MATSILVNEMEVAQRKRFGINTEYQCEICLLRIFLTLEYFRRSST